MTRKSASMILRINDSTPDSRTIFTDSRKIVFAIYYISTWYSGTTLINRDKACHFMA